MYVYFMRVQAISKMCFCTGRGRRHVVFFVIFSSHDLPTTEKVLKYMQTRAWYINPRSAAFAVWVVGTGACTESMTADRIVTFEFDKMCPQRNVHVQIAVQIAVERRTSFL